jgi:hypothetical protein
MPAAKYANITLQVVKHPQNPTFQPNWSGTLCCSGWSARNHGNTTDDWFGLSTPINNLYHKC